MLRRIFSTLGLSLSIASVALAQNTGDKDAEFNNEGWNVFAGGGALVLPNYPGDDSYKVLAVPFVRVSHGDKFFASIPEGMGYVVIDQDGFRAGPLAVLNFGRSEESNNPFRVIGKTTSDLAGLGDIDPTVQIGGFVEYEFGDVELNFRAGRAVSGHDGTISKIGLSYKKRFQSIGPPVFVKAGPNIRLADGNYVNAFYGLTPAQSAASGLPAFKAGGGIVSYGVNGSLLVPVSYTAGFGFFATYDHLSGDAGSSPLVLQRGSRNQVLGGMAFAKKF